MSRSVLDVRLSVFARFLLGTVASVLLALGVVALALPGLTENLLLAEKERELTERGRGATETAAAFLSGQLPEQQAQSYLDALGSAGDAQVWVVDDSGTIVLDSGTVPGLTVGSTGPGPGMGQGPGQGSGQGRHGFGRGSRLTGTDTACVMAGQAWSNTGTFAPYDDPVVSVAVPVTSPDGSSVLGAVYLNSPVSGVSETAGRLREYLLLAGAVGLIAAAGAAVVLSRRITGPVRRMNTMAKRIAEGDLAVRCEEAGSDEIGQLGRSLNQMAARLEDSQAERARLELVRQELVANVSHDLRSPITAIRGYVEPLLDGTIDDEATRRRYLETVRSETEALGALVTDLLELSRLEAGGASLRLEPFNVGLLTREAAARYEARARERGIALDLSVGEELPAVEADEARITRVIRNLMDNAFRFTPDGGRVSVAVQAAAGPEVVVEVGDSGPGVSPEDLPFIWDRFYKADKSRRRDCSGCEPTEGSGLGLAIVRETVKAHGGRVEVESQPGRGATFRVYLPAAPA